MFEGAARLPGCSSLELWVRLAQQALQGTMRRANRLRTSAWGPRAKIYPSTSATNSGVLYYPTQRATSALPPHLCKQRSAARTHHHIDSPSFRPIQAKKRAALNTSTKKCGPLRLTSIILARSQASSTSACVGRSLSPSTSCSSECVSSGLGGGDSSDGDLAVEVRYLSF